MTYKSDGKIDTSKLGTNVGDRLFLSAGKNEKLNNYLKTIRESTIEDFVASLTELKTEEKEELRKKLLEELENGKILSYSMSGKDEKDFLKIYSDDNADKLDIITNEDGSREIIIKEYADLSNIKDDYEIIKTKMVRRIINGTLEEGNEVARENSLDVVIQLTRNEKISSNSEINNKWNKYTSALNSILNSVNTENNSFFQTDSIFNLGSSQSEIITGDVIFYNLNQPKRTYISIDKNGELIEDVNYKGNRPIEQHELVVHPSDYFMLKRELETEGEEEFEFINPTNSKIYRGQSQKGDEVVYIQDRYVEIKNSEGKIEKKLQPFKRSETNTIIFETMTNNRYYKNNKFNTRFLYDMSFKKGMINLEDVFKEGSKQ